MGGEEMTRGSETRSAMVVQKIRRDARWDLVVRQWEQAMSNQSFMRWASLVRLLESCLELDNDPDMHELLMQARRMTHQ